MKIPAFPLQYGSTHDVFGSFKLTFSTSIGFNIQKENVFRLGTYSNVPVWRFHLGIFALIYFCDTICDENLL